MLSIIIRLITVVRSFFDFNGKKVMKELDIQPGEVKQIYHAWVVVKNEFGEKEHITITHDTWDNCKHAIDAYRKTHEIISWHLRPARS